MSYHEDVRDEPTPSYALEAELRAIRWADDLSADLRSRRATIERVTLVATLVVGLLGVALGISLALGSLPVLTLGQWIAAFAVMLVGVLAARAVALFVYSSQAANAAREIEQRLGALKAAEDVERAAIAQKMATQFMTSHVSDDYRQEAVRDDVASWLARASQDLGDDPRRAHAVTAGLMESLRAFTWHEAQRSKEEAAHVLSQAHAEASDVLERAYAEAESTLSAARARLYGEDAAPAAEEERPTRARVADDFE